MKTALPLILALSSMAHRSRARLECNIPNDKVNASDSVTLTDPFRTPNGLFQNGSGQWTWTLATQSGSSGSTNNGNGTGGTNNDDTNGGTNNKDISVGQVLRLKPALFRTCSPQISAILDAALSSTGYHDKRFEGQSSARGRCDNALSAVCVSRTTNGGRKRPISA